MHQISNNVLCATSKASDQPDQSLYLPLEYSMTVKLLTEHHLEFQSLKGGCRGLSESTHVKKPHCWKSLAAAHIKLIHFTVISESFALDRRQEAVDSSAPNI